MTHLKRPSRRANAKRLLLSSLFFLSIGAGTSQAQQCPKPVFTPFDATINTYTTNGFNYAKLEFLPSLLDSSSVTFSYNMTGATTESGSSTTGTGAHFNVGITYVAVSATNTCGTTTLNFTVNVSNRFHELGQFQGHTYYRTPHHASWADADSMARSIGGNLIAINSPAEDFFLSRAVPDTMRAWIGLRKESGVWKWTNGDSYGPGDFSNWCPVQPDNWMNNQDYALIHSRGVPVGTDACWDDAQSPNNPETNEPNSFYAVVETVPATCTSSIAVTASTAVATFSTPDRIFIGYGPQSDTLNASLTGIGNPMFSWSGDAISMLNCTKCASPEFTPTKPGNYSFTVTATDRRGCTATATKTICVMDVRERNASGALTGDIWVCHGSADKDVALSSVAGHLGHGDALGRCNQACGSTARTILAGNQQAVGVSTVQVYPNPAQNEFFVEVPETEEAATVALMDIQGKVLEVRTVNPNDVRKVRFDLSNSPRGMYLVDVTYGDQRYHAKIVRQ